MSSCHWADAREGRPRRRPASQETCHHDRNSRPDGVRREGSSMDQEGERLGVMVCGHGSRDVEACWEFAALVRHIAGRLPDWPVEHGYLEFARPILRDGLEALKAKGARQILAVPGMLFAAGHVKNDVPSVLNRWAMESGVPVAHGPRPRDRREAAGRRSGPDRGRARAVGPRGRARGDAPAGRRPRHLRQRRQRQRRQGGADAVGGHGLRPCRDRLFGCRPSTYRRGARARHPPRLPADRRLSLFSVHGRPGAADLRRRRCRRPRPSRDRDPQGRLSQRPSGRRRHLRRAHHRHPRRRRRDELRLVQVSRPDPRPRARPGRAAGKPSPPRRGDRHRRRPRPFARPPRIITTGTTTITRPTTTEAGGAG